MLRESKVPQRNLEDLCYMSSIQTKKTNETSRILESYEKGKTSDKKTYRKLILTELFPDIRAEAAGNSLEPRNKFKGSPSTNELDQSIFKSLKDLSFVSPKTIDLNSQISILSPILPKIQPRH